MPMGISPAVSVLDMLSMAMRNDAPNAQLTGMSLLLSFPTIMRPTWGMMSPTHPMFPLTHTAPAVDNVANTIAASLFMFELMPRV